MKPTSLPYVFSVALFTIGFAFDMATTLMFAGSPFCQEANPFFAPFMLDRYLLVQAMVTAWFFTFGIATIAFLLVDKYAAKYWFIPVGWYMVTTFWGINHLLAGFHNLPVIPICWSGYN
jgi:hypothetical protein